MSCEVSIIAMLHGFTKSTLGQACSDLLGYAEEFVCEKGDVARNTLNLSFRH